MEEKTKVEEGWEETGGAGQKEGTKFVNEDEKEEVH